jgi:flagellar basal-body rod modification protein FlgD
VVAALTGALTGSALPSSQSATARAQVTQADFLNLLITELRSQDPFEPLKNSEFLNQIATLNQIESYATLTDGIRNLQVSNELANASSLLGKAVVGVTDSGIAGGGVVSRVLVQDGQVRLVIGDQTMPLSAVAQVFMAESLPEEGS